MRDDEALAAVVATAALTYLFVKRPRAIVALAHALVSEEERKPDAKRDADEKAGSEAVEKGPV